MVFEPTFESIDGKADALPDLEGGNPFAGDAEGSDLAATGGTREEEAADLAEGGVEAGLRDAEVPFEELPPYGE
jgi:hypothetical protein